MEKPRYSRLVDIIELMILLNKPQGITIEGIMAHYNVSRRTSYRMLDVLLNIFPQIDVIRIDEYNRNVWGFKDCNLKDILN